MATLINSTATFFNDAYDYYLWTLSLADERTRGWLLVDSPMPTLFYTILYLSVVWSGPKLMKNRKAFKLTWILIPYNFAMAILNAFLPAMVNSFIHVLMYSYYGLAAIGPHVTKYLWWKKYLTILQLIQFTTALILGINGIRSGCDFPLWMQYALVIYMISFIVLFGNFYAKAYIAKGKQAYANRQKTSRNAIANASNSKINGQHNGIVTNGVSKKIQ
ncbi:hypothetical protein PV325_012085 [Microctonus aethiopoides]|nr:hypothetical protein PV325_012085 [Microctonus aethiopoides]